MADWFKLHENWFTEPRLQWAIKEQPNVVQTWLWVLTECCRTKSDTIGLHTEDYEMLGIQQLLNINPGIFNQSLKLLAKIKYIQIDETAKTIQALKWNEFQSDYLIKKSRRDADKDGQDPTVSDKVGQCTPRGEEIREEKKREDEISDEAWLQDLKTKSPGIDFESELLKMDRWLSANPRRKKTRRFIVGWMNRADKALPKAVNLNRIPSHVLTAEERGLA